MIAAEVTAGCGLVVIIAGVGRLVYLTGQLVQRLDSHIVDAERIWNDHEARLRKLEILPKR